MFETKMSNAESIFLNEALMATAEKYEKLRLQRLNASKAWIKRNKPKVLEYNRVYSKKLYAKKKENKEPIEKIVNIEEYKKYQADYRLTKRLRQLPFFNSPIAF